MDARFLNRDGQSSANRCSTDRTVHGCVDFNIAGREKTLAVARLLRAVTRARPQKRFQAFRRGKQRLYGARANVPRHHTPLQSLIWQALFLASHQLCSEAVNHEIDLPF